MEKTTVSPEVELGEDVECKPQIGMLFNTEQEAYDFYNKYGGSVGFSIRRDFANKSKKDKTTITSRRFACYKSGVRHKDKRDIDTSKPRAEIRTMCPAWMSIYLLENGKYKCCDFIEEHNHILHLPNTTHMMRSQRKISDIHTYEIDLADDSGIKPKSMFEYMGRHAGGRENLGCTSQDHKNYLRTKRQHSLAYGEPGSLLRYFENQSSINHSFTYSMQLDNDEQITNIFWADPKMRIDYAQFGDVVSFDTTFCTNKEYRPFGIFAGFNHHRGAIIFGAALLYDETAESFKWLFEAFAEAHGQKKPITIFTDQDAAMAKALTEFEDEWQKLLKNYEVENNSWLQRIYGLKYKWAKCYMKNTFTLGMRSTQLSESLNSDMKDYLKSTLDIVQFFKHFERMDWVSACLIKNKNESNLMSEFFVGLVESKYIKCIPPAYILKRWTRGARSLVVTDNKGKQVEEDSNLDSSQRYRSIMPELVKMASQASNSAEGYALVMQVTKELRVQLDCITASNGPQVVVPDEVPMFAAGLKKKEKCPSGRRKKNRIEKQGKKRKRTETRNTQVSQEIHSAPARTSGTFSMSNVPDYLQQMDDNISFTSLLTGGTSMYDLSLAVEALAQNGRAPGNYFLGYDGSNPSGLKDCSL
ncbi:protein FAR1-RELATED SEQUENCE 5-like [Telopea speciosissima]|uniref:protein FAR1-RELATED SEQUENCE 5-like n=1 Tax=Telopea speciosissima TaxID=54955 RepID=UPI001CC623B9|nr:protein FAR1-RELATED SEQUENCE 5-like [Telopea speciosissima]